MRCLLCLGWRERTEEQSTGPRGGSAPTCPSCQPGTLAITVPLTLGQPGERWALGTLLTLPTTHRLAAACNRSPGPSAESPWSGKRHSLQKRLKLRGCFIRGTHQSLRGFDGPHGAEEARAGRQAATPLSISGSHRAFLVQSGCISASRQHASRGPSLQLSARSRRLLSQEAGRSPPASPCLIPTSLCSAPWEGLGPSFLWGTLVWRSHQHPSCAHTKGHHRGCSMPMKRSRQDL